MVRVPSRVPSLTLVAAGAALLAPTTPPAAPPPPEPRALSHAPPPSRATAPSRRAARGPQRPLRPVARPPLREDGPVRAADLLTAVRDCEPVSRGQFRADAQVGRGHPVLRVDGSRTGSFGRRSARIASTAASAISPAVIIGRRSRPGSPWMPMPSSSSPAGRSKVGLPLAGVVQAPSATPKLRNCR
ncbi:hypothetical protein SFUMM280S_05646 [Streptomyces fumanus]